MEEYRDVPGYENKYQVSNLGNVKSLVGKGTLLKKSINKGYFRVGLYYNKYQKHFLVHQLVAMAFLGHKPNGHDIVVDHINMDKLDNRVENLRLITTRENTTKSHIQSTSKYVGVYLYKRSNKWKAQITYKSKRIPLGTFKTEIEAHECYTNFCIKNKIIY